MDEFLALCRSTLIADAVMQGLFSGAGPAVAVTIRTPGGKDVAVYPSIIMAGMPGQGIVGGEGTEITIDGTIKLYALAKFSSTVSAPYTTAQSIMLRARDVLVGDSLEGIPGLLGRSTAHWKVSAIKGISPCGPVSNVDPAVESHQCTIKVCLYRLG